jgi:hypothetical protein
MSPSQNTSFVFGTGAGNQQFDFSSPAPATEPVSLPPPASSSTGPYLPPSSGNYVTLAQYEIVESRYEQAEGRYQDVLKRLDILEAETTRAAEAEKVLKLGAKSMEKAYKSLQQTYTAAEGKIKALEIQNQDLGKKLGVCKAALQASQQQHKATSAALEGALGRESKAVLLAAATAEAAAAAIAPRPLPPRPVLGFAALTTIDLPPVAAAPTPAPAAPTLGFAAITSVELAPVAAPTPSSPPPTLVLAPVVPAETVDVAAQTEGSPPSQKGGNWQQILLLLLLCVRFCGWMLVGSPAGGEPLGYGGAFGQGDGVVARAHAWALGVLVASTGGVQVLL